VPALGDAIARLPASVAGGMLAGLLLRFALGLFQAAAAAPGLVLPLLAVFLVARLLHPASAPLLVIAAAVPLALAEGYALPAPDAALSTLAWMPPHFSLPALAGLGVPLFLVTMATQQISGAAVLRTSGYVPPVRAALITTGLTTLALAPFGAYSVNLSSITAAICTGPDAHPDKAKRWLTGPVYALCYLVFAVFGASLASSLGGLPPVLISTVAGAALLGPLTAALASALHREAERFAAVLAFAVTASGLTLAGIGAAFWGLMAGLLALGLERALRRRR
jgi:benzoate membrane transport protein